MQEQVNKAFMYGKYNKRIKRALPDYDLPRPPGPLSLTGMESTTEVSLKLKSEKECCIIFPLFEAYEGIIPHYVINSAFWAAHAWRVNTDLIEKGWDIWFFVDRRLWAKTVVKEQFEKAHLEDFVLLFDVPKGRAIRHTLGSKLYAATSPYFQSYYRCYMADTDMFPSIRDPQNIIKTERLLDIGEDESLFMNDRYSYFEQQRRNIWRELYEMDIEEEEARLIYDSYVEKYLGYIPTGYWACPGQIYAWNPQKLRQDFKDMVIELTPNISDDEEQFGFYMAKTGARPAELRHIWHIPIYYGGRTDYFRDDPHYFDHVWLDRDKSDWETWHRQSHKQEVDAVSEYEVPELKSIWADNIGLYRRY